MSKRYEGKVGTSIKIIMGKIGKELNTDQNRPRKPIDRNHYISGSLTSTDTKNIGIGLEALVILMDEGFEKMKIQLLSGEQDVSGIKSTLFSYRFIMQDIISRLNGQARYEYNIKRDGELLPDYAKILQAARDGIIIKEETRHENIDGKLQEVSYDTSMTPEEVMDILERYDGMERNMQFERLQNYLGLGLGLAGMIGTLVNENKNKNKSRNEENGKNTGALLNIGLTVIAALKLIQNVSKAEEREEQFRLKDKKRRLKEGLLGHEQISSKAEEEQIHAIEDVLKEERAVSNRIENKRFTFDLITNLAVAIISGAYVNSKVQRTKDGKIDGKSLASALVALQATNGIGRNLLGALKGIQDSLKENEEYKEIYKKTREILSQMEEKVYPLEGATEKFDSLQIRDFVGQFYPKKNYQTGEIEYSTTIYIPEFSMQRGDIILLSGESGSGKSTFLRLLKRGDINNRKCIMLGNGEMVDNLGEEIISFRPSIDLGDETNILSQITGKENVSDLNEEEKQRLIKILSELNLNFDNLLEQLASKKFMEFSTGQQRRLALSKLFYRIDDGTSVIIVDEPVGNVEDRLIREQLKMITEYAKSRNVMLILTTHRLDLAEDLVTKRYNINKDGVMEQIPISRTTEELEP